MHVACRRVRALPGAQGRVAPTPVRALGKMRYGDILNCSGALQGGPLLHWNSGVSNFEELASAGLGVLGVHEGKEAQGHSHAPPFAVSHLGIVVRPLLLVGADRASVDILGFGFGLRRVSSCCCI